MRLVVDSSAWIEWLAAGPQVDAIGTHLRAGEIVVPTIVMYEVHKWVAREQSEDLAAAVAGFLRTQTVVPLDEATAILASDVARHAGLASADAIILAHTRTLGARLLTLDHHFEHMPEAIYYPNGGRLRA